jgi:hypothetical protein
MRLVRLFGWAILLPCLFPVSACRSYRIDATIENHTGGVVSLLEVDYPSASFGTDTLASDDIFRYRLQTRGSGPVKVQYMAGNGRTVQITGPTIYEKQEGSIDIVLLPDGKAEFHPKLNPQH